MADEPKDQPTPVSPAPAGNNVRPSDGLAVSSLILGILACVSFWIFPVCAVFAVASVLLGRLAQSRMREAAPLRPGARSWATAGIVLSFSGVLLSSALLGSCYCLVKNASQKGQEEFNKELKNLDNDPEFKRQLEELRKDVKALDEQKNEAQKPDDSEGD